jgi:hypothetical protein
MQVLNHLLLIHQRTNQPNPLLFHHTNRRVHRVRPLKDPDESHQIDLDHADGLHLQALAQVLLENQKSSSLFASHLRPLDLVKVPCHFLGAGLDEAAIEARHKQLKQPVQAEQHDVEGHAGHAPVDDLEDDRRECQRVEQPTHENDGREQVDVGGEKAAIRGAVE